MFSIEWEENAIREFNKLENFVARRILKRIGMLKEKDFLFNVKKLKNSKSCSLRAGDYRIIFDLDMEKKIIRILKIGHRKNIYEN